MKNRAAMRVDDLLYEAGHAGGNAIGCLPYAKTAA